MQMNSLEEVIRIRHSCRSYLKKRVDPLTLGELESYMKSHSSGVMGEGIKLGIVTRDPAVSKPMKLNYGMITNHSSYILGRVKAELIQRVSYGYVVEKVVLKATALGLATCWVGYFDPEYFSEIDVQGEAEIPSIVVVGYPDKTSLGDQLTRFAVKASKRKPWHELFFINNFAKPLTEKEAGRYAHPLAMLRLAPSSGNTQPWRVLMEANGRIFHFFKKAVSERYEEKGLHDVDMGIALAHFELSANLARLSGEWKILKNEGRPRADSMSYTISWVSQG